MYNVTVTINGNVIKSTSNEACLYRAIFNAEREIIAPLMEANPGEPINLEIVEEKEILPDFHCGRYGDFEDAGLTPFHVIQAEIEGSPTLYFTRAGAWVEDKSLAKLYWSQMWAENAIFNPACRAVPA